MVSVHLLINPGVNQVFFSYMFCPLSCSDCPDFTCRGWSTLGGINFFSKILTKGDAITSYPIGQTSIFHQPAQFLNLLGYVIKEILFLSFFPVYRKCKKWQTTFGQIIRKFNFRNFSSLFSYKRTINTGIWNDIANIISSAVFL